MHSLPNLGEKEFPFDQCNVDPNHVVERESEASPTLIDGMRNNVVIKRKTSAFY